MIRPALLLLAVAISVSPVHAAATKLPPEVERTLQGLDVHVDQISAFVQDARTHEVILDINGETSRSPASTMKVITTFAALDTLGPAYTWKTRAYTRGTLRRDTLEGDLILVGGGDPYMTLERWWSFLNGLRHTGLKRIDGDVVIDNSLFSASGQDRAAFDQQPLRAYNVLPDALLVNFQASTFNITADALTNRAEVTVDPLPAGLTIKNELRLGSGRCGGYNYGVSFDSSPKGDADELIVSGVFPAACQQFAIARAVMTAPTYAYGVFKTLWEQLGGSTSGKLRLGVVPENATLAYSYDSLTLAEIIRLVNKYSNNVMARHLLLTLGAEKVGVPATMDAGRKVLYDWLGDHGIASAGTHIDNGSGLSREERTTAKSMASVLQAACESPLMPEFAASLPLAATDGTLRRRFRTPAMQGRLRMKTGRIDDVSAIAGYVSAASGATYIVVIFVNAPNAHNGPGEEIQAALINWVFAR